MSIWHRSADSPARTYEQTCLDCGAEFTAAASHAKRCPPCRALNQRERQAEFELRRQAQKEQVAYRNWDRLQFEILADPTGDFVAGARLTDMDLKFSLHLGALPVGLQVRDRKTGRVRTVLTLPNGRQAFDQ